MCIILNISHSLCTHTVAVWQHCIHATRSSQAGMTPCWNVKQHSQAALTSRPCEDCSRQQRFARRGGLADQGLESPFTNPWKSTNARSKDRPPTFLSGSTDDEADDSGYHSDVITEGRRIVDHERSISPKALAPRRCGARRSCWKPSLKRDVSFSCETEHHRRESSHIDAHMASPHDADRRARQASTLLHPSSPPSQPPARPPQLEKAQIAHAFPFPRVVDVRRSIPLPILVPIPVLSEEEEDEKYTNQIITTPRKNSTLLHPSAPALQHPRPSTIPTSECTYKTVISIPPRHARSNTPTTHLPLRRMPPLLQTTQSEPLSWTMAQRRKESVLHSCLSDDDDDGDGDRDGDGDGAFGKSRQTWSGDVETYMLRRSAEYARAGRSAEVARTGRVRI